MNKNFCEQNEKKVHNKHCLILYELIIQLVLNKVLICMQEMVCKGQLISKCPFVVKTSSKKNKNKISSRISAKASKKKSIRKNCVRESK